MLVHITIDIPHGLEARVAVDACGGCLEKACYAASAMAARHVDLLEAIRALPREARFRLVEQMIRDLAEDRVADGRSIVGLFRDEPDLIEDVGRAAMEARERDPLRVARG